MKKPMIQTGILTNVCPKLAAMLFCGAIFAAMPLPTALAQTAPDLGTASSFAVLDGAAVTLTNAAVIGDVGSPGAVTVTSSTVTGTVYPAGDATAVMAYDDSLYAYDSVALEQCETTLTGDLAGQWLVPGVYCVEAASTTTNGTLTLDAQGDPNGVWIFKIGTLGTGALTGTGLSVVMENGGQPCNVYWWTAEAVTMSTSNFKGTILAGTASTFTGGSMIGRVFGQTGVTMTGTDVFGCNNLVPVLVPVNEETCQDFYNQHDYHHDNHKDACNQGIGNGSEDCDPGHSNQGDSDRSNDEDDNNRKGGNHKDDDNHKSSNNR